MIPFTFSEPTQFGLRPTYWMNGTRIFEARATLPADATVVDAHRPLAVVAKQRGDMIYLDGEAVPDLGVLVASIRVVRDGCPGIKMAAYGVFPGPFRVEELIALAGGASNPAMDAYLRGLKGLHAPLDWVTLDVYMFGPDYVARDLKRVVALSQLARKYIDKPLMFAVWSCFHAAYNPANSLLPDPVMAKYVSLVKSRGDVTVFDPTPGRDERFVGLFASGSE